MTHYQNLYRSDKIIVNVSISMNVVEIYDLFQKIDRKTFDESSKPLLRAYELYTSRKFNSNVKIRAVL